ncbi:hypothetical protein ES705_42383 [subsurface metagenome]
MIKIKKIKHSKVILIFVAIFLLVLFIGNLSRKAEAQGKIIKHTIIIVDTNNESKRGNAGWLDFLLEKISLPEYMKQGIIAFKKSMNIETLLEGCNRIGNKILVEWMLEYYYSEGYRVACVVGDWIILVDE